MAIHAAAGEPLCIGVEEQDRERHRRKLQRKRVQLPRRDYQQGGRGDREGRSEAHRKLTFGQSAICGARVATVVFNVGDTVHGHRSGARPDHRDDNP
jgi:hypothetical protein